MPDFAYQGRDRQGKTVKGVVNASSASTVADQLIRKGIVPLSISEGKVSDGFDFKRIVKVIFSRPLPLPDLVMFIRQMYSLTKAGISMLRAIEGLAENASNKKLQSALKDIATQLEKGRSLSASMADHPECFPRLVIAVVHVGENTGQLEESFSQLSYYLENEQETRKRLKQATRYPSFVLATLVVAIFLLNLFVIPQFARMFQSMNAELPLITKILLGSSSVFQQYWWLIILAGIAGWFGLRYQLQSKQFQRRWDKWKLKVPAIGNVLERSLLARFCRSFSVMLNAGVPLTQALNLVADAVDNQYMAERIVDMRKGVERGEALSRVSKSSGLFSLLVLQMISVGEETGNLDDLLLEAAEYYEREVDYDLKNLLAKIEPMLVGFVAIIVGVLAMGIFLPMWGMMEAAGGL
ncbi:MULTISPECIES: type II secretion system F family protein [Gammaproteobacteria]|uniref:type II secretion system F family protein n=1 Tax=Gammaproteobacteria TaxID=1236 RepID=UPI000DD0C7FE|nr:MULTISPECIES: type II secretion system F family protein [Gammaproteobacteria]RTE86388.1 type II secretion system F family protein [Aliidiomarina sp. B3213]TCZ91735.1 type II secretion system F family protein [Lysobacter sp. N42]